MSVSPIAASIAAFLLLQSASVLFGQTTVVTSSEKNGKDAQTIMSPFVVSTDQDTGYRAANTLSGARMNTSLFQTPAAISVLNKELLDDIGAETTQDYLRFATNSDHDTISSSGNQVGQNSDVVVKIRGFTGASLTRDYFTYPTVNSDRFNIERIEASRGPNAVLYGIGGPGGVINVSTKQALLNSRQRSLSFSTGSYDKTRSEIDLAAPLIADKLAVRFNALYEDKNGWAEFEFARQKGAAVAVTYKPFSDTTIRVNWEGLDSRLNRRFDFPPFDGGGTKWLAAGAAMSGPVLPGNNPDPVNLVSANQQQILYAPQLRPQPFRLSTLGGADMRPDIAGVQAAGFWTTRNPPVAPVGTGVDDPYFGTLIPERANLAGPGSVAATRYSIGSGVIEQRLSRHLVAELAYSNLDVDRRAFFATAADTRLVGDPNLVLPGAYSADGDATIAGGSNPGTPLADIGARNPQAGGLYVQGRPFVTYQEWDNSYLRGTLGYKLDLSKKSKWLGTHNLAVMGQKDEVLYGVRPSQEYNTTPKNSRPIDDLSNQIVRRTYIDFKAKDGLRGMVDPWANLIPASAGVTADWLVSSPLRLFLTEVKTAMAAIQSSFFKERLVLTGGIRHDKQVTDTATAGGIPVPNSTNLWYRVHDEFQGTAFRREFSGNTKTLGLFVAPLPWLALTYNQSDSVLPQAALDLLGRSLGTRSGQGKDYGIRCNLLESKLSLNVNYYQNDDVNRVYQEGIQQLLNNYNPSILAITNTLNQNRLPLPKALVAAGVDTLGGGAGARDLADSNGDGFETELVGQITKSWSISFNYSHTRLKLGDAAARTKQFHAETKGDWDNNNTSLISTPGNVQDYVRQRDNTPNRDFVLNPGTFNDAYDWAGEVLKTLSAAEGQVPLGHVEDSFNVFTSYRFGADTPALLRQGRFGIGGNYRGRGIIGYDAARNNAPIKGDSTFQASVMLGKRIGLKRAGQSIDFQLNINNVFGDEDLVPYSAVAPGQIVRYYFPRVRRTWDLRAVYRF